MNCDNCIHRFDCIGKACLGFIPDPDVDIPEQDPVEEEARYRELCASIEREERD